MIVTAREFTSAAEMRAHAMAVHRRCFNPVARVSKPIVAKPVTVFVTKKLPLWMIGEVQFDAHMFEWRDRAGNQPKAYLKDRCRELDIPYQVMIGADRRREISNVRQVLIWELHQKFGMSFPALGRLFGGRDHTTVLYTVRKIEARMRGAA